MEEENTNKINKRVFLNDIYNGRLEKILSIKVVGLRELYLNI